ncbi:hypothetical protein CH252_40585 [Rhodococcus sp. 06-1477-1B]|nr:hypothetical protein CH252_40585 [Rhodococcus sp. 06-1477-1B]
MIQEQPTVEFMAFEVFDRDTEQWREHTGQLQSLSFSRGGKQDGLAVIVAPGILTATLLNASRDDFRPNTPVRVIVDASGAREPVFTGRISDVGGGGAFNRTTGTETHTVTLTATDAVAAHAATPRYGVRADPETWAQRIRRLADSSLTETVLPEDDGPVTRYELA